MKYTTVFFDFDGVIIDPEFILDGLIAGGSQKSKTWIKLKLVVFLIWWAIRNLDIKYNEGKEAYIIKIIQELALKGTQWYGGCDVSKVLDYYKKKRPIEKDMKETLKILRDQGIDLYIVSTMDREIIKKYLMIDGILDYFKEVIGSSIDYLDENTPSGCLDLSLPENDVISKGKGYVVEKIMADYNIPKEKTAGIGDGETDIPMFLKVGTPIVFNPGKSRRGKTNLRLINKMLTKDPIVIEGTAKDLLTILT